MKIASTSLMIILFSHFFAMAQKLPSVQQGSIRAPENIKIDGKTTEWENILFKTYNKTNQIYYAISNDDNKLYLIVKAPAPMTVDKLITGGLTLTISHDLNSKRKNNKGNVMITFPVHEITYNETLQGPREYQNFKTDTIANKRQIDSLMYVYNKKAIATLNLMSIKGIKEIKDPVISKSNNYGIAAIAQFDHEMALIYELAVPLNYLGLTVNNSTQFSYNIKLNGYPLTVKEKPSRFPTPIIEHIEGEPIDFDYQFLNSASDFWSEYTLVKK